MPEISFYVLATTSEQERSLYACRLIEKAYRNGHICYVLTDTDEQAQALDDLLWTFRAGSFVPHQRYDGSLPGLERVILISPLDPPEMWRKTLVNLSSRMPADYERAERILEIVYDNEEVRGAGRHRYRQYRQAGIEITTHTI